ncbi:hypothetical protein SLEP1_g60217 [Rubroshorea leprosula]|uniref:Uncharacterized protein n=1 Tax=Rubroshorea leprosula TaxID=152421 RepID=A0AAV5MUN6_9ROSI|nr:hypothetical protein SLEP1_g60217 [Rubroshorea leprosula]
MGESLEHNPAPGRRHHVDRPGGRSRQPNHCLFSVGAAEKSRRMGLRPTSSSKNPLIKIK